MRGHADCDMLRICCKLPPQETAPQAAPVRHVWAPVTALGVSQRRNHVAQRRQALQHNECSSGFCGSSAGDMGAAARSISSSAPSCHAIHPLMSPPTHLVDLLALLQPLAGGARHVHALAARQIHQVQLAHLSPVSQGRRGSNMDRSLKHCKTEGTALGRAQSCRVTYAGWSARPHLDALPHLAGGGGALAHACRCATAQEGSLRSHMQPSHREQPHAARTHPQLQAGTHLAPCPPARHLRWRRPVASTSPQSA